MKNQEEKIAHQWTLVCRNSSIDQKNLISLFEILEDYNVDIKLKNNKTLPTILNVPTSFQIVTMWSKNELGSIEVKSEVEIEYIDPNKKILGTFHYDLIIPDNKKRFRNIVTVNAVGVSTSGQYTFRVKKREPQEKDYKVVGEYHFQIKVNKEVEK